MSNEESLVLFYGQRHIVVIGVDSMDKTMTESFLFTAVEKLCNQYLYDQKLIAEELYDAIFQQLTK